MNEDLYDQYKTDPDVKAYVDRYCVKHDKNIFEAFRDVMVKEAAKHIKDQKKDIIEGQI